MSTDGQTPHLSIASRGINSFKKTPLFPIQITNIHGIKHTLLSSDNKHLRCFFVLCHKPTNITMPLLWSLINVSLIQREQKKSNTCSKRDRGLINLVKCLNSHELAHFIQKRSNQLCKSDIAEDIKHKWISKPAPRHNHRNTQLTHDV